MIPTDLPSCIAWHEASYEAGADGTSPSFLFGAGGTSNGPTQSTSGKRPVLATVGGKRVYTFDNTDDVMDTAGVISFRTFTIVTCFASQTTAAGKRVFCNNPSNINWLFGPRAETGGGTKWSNYNGWSWATSIVVDTNYHVHSIVSDNVNNPGTLVRCDGMNGTSHNSNRDYPGRLRIGGGDQYTGEHANCHLVGLAIFNTNLPEADLFEIEQHFNGGAFPSAPKRMTQVVSEVAYETGKVRETQLLAEMSYEAGMIRPTQELIELTYEAGAIRFTQFLIELMHEPTGDLNWRTPRERPDFGDARRIRDVHRGAGHRWIDNPGRRA